MEKFKLNINGKEVKGLPGQTILEVARENDIFIPTLCYDERTKIYGSCGICMCEVEGNPKLCKACATVIAPGMVIRTNTERVIESRKTNLELLLSKNPKIRVVINCIALESVGEAMNCLKELPLEQVDIAQVQVAKGKKAGSYHLMMGQNPVYVISCQGKEETDE